LCPDARSAASKKGAWYGLPRPRKFDFYPFLECGSALLCRFGFFCFSWGVNNSGKTRETKAAEQSTAALHRKNKKTHRQKQSLPYSKKGQKSK
jgi:hypothetical protein